MQLKYALIATLAFIIINGIDRLMSWQTLQRPIVAGPITGLLLGDLNTGIIMGAALEAIFMGISVIGGSVPSDALTATIIVVAFTKITGADIETGIALSMPIGTLMSTVQELYKPVLASLAPAWERLAGTGNTKRFTLATVISGVFVDRLAHTLVLFIAIAFGVEGLQATFDKLPLWFMSGLSAASSMMTGVGFAILLSMIWDKEVGGFFFFGFVLAKYLQLDALPIAIIAGVIAMLYFYNDKKLVALANSGVSNDDAEDFF